MTRIVEVGQPPALEFVSDPVAKPMLIDGQWVQAASGETFETINPTNGAVIARVAAGGSADVNRAVAAARRAFEDPAWSDMNPHQRTRVLLRIADAIEAHAQELALLESLDGGIPITITRNLIAGAAETFRYYAGWPTKMLGTVNPVDASVHCYSVREPVGVCAGIVP